MRFKLPTRYARPNNSIIDNREEWIAAFLSAMKEDGNTLDEALVRWWIGEVIDSVAGACRITGLVETVFNEDEVLEENHA